MRDGSFLGLWVITEIVGRILIAAFGFGGTIWLLAVTLAIGVVFAMIYGAIRVLRGDDLEDSQKPN